MRSDGRTTTPENASTMMMANIAGSFALKKKRDDSFKMPIKFSKETSTRLFRYVKSVDIKFNPFDGRTKSTREIWRQLQAARYHNANPKLKINTHVMGTPNPPEVIFKFIDDTEKRFDSQNLKANEIMFDVHLDLDRLDNEYEMSGKSLDD